MVCTLHELSRSVVYLNAGIGAAVGAMGRACTSAGCAAVPMANRVLLSVQGDVRVAGQLHTSQDVQLNELTVEVSLG